MEEALAAFEELVRRFSGRLNLVAAADLPRLRERHSADSLRLLPFAESTTGACIDVGSGAGFPGIPLALALPDRVWRLLEPRRRRAAFLEEVVRDLDLDNVEVIALSAQQAATDPRLAGAHGFAAARALAPPAQAFALLKPLTASGGVCALLFGERAEIPSEAEEPSEGIAIVRID
jgi:16S rRNA (guanine527-N7)-methyltransferase